eukprot:6004688-Pyramimonas_sp.AAC.1
MVRDPKAHAQVIAALWGTLGHGPPALDVGGHLARQAPPLAHQVEIDLWSFAGISGMGDFDERWEEWDYSYTAFFHNDE